MLTSFSDRLNVFGMIYLSLLVNEVKIKLDSRSASHYQLGLSIEKRKKNRIYAAFFLITAIIFLITILWKVKVIKNVKIYWISYLMSESLYISIDIYVIVRFIKNIIFLRNYKFRRAGLSVKQQVIVLAIYILTGMHILARILSLIYPI